MPRYKVLRSIAHNQAHSFLSLTNYGDDDYFACHLIRASMASAVDELEVDLLDERAGPAGLMTPEVKTAIGYYRANFGRLVVTGGATMAMIRTATMNVRLHHGHVTGDPSDQTLAAKLHATVTIVDDRGTTHIGGHVEAWSATVSTRATRARHLLRWWWSRLTG